ncbi:hypothetical protein QZH41_002919 [Actinostola sp. cb2023]|nr:hypothetical protein QZH41_002919 [Actinostola sp. cb2023]
MHRPPPPPVPLPLACGISLDEGVKFTPLTRTISRFPWEFELAGLYCGRDLGFLANSCSQDLDKPTAEVCERQLKKLIEDPDHFFDDLKSAGQQDTSF